MAKERWIKLFMGIAALSCVVWVLSLAWTLQDYWGGSAPAAATPLPMATDTPEPVKSDGKFRLLALGDSLTRGTGDPGGKGYVGYLLENLKEQSQQEIVLHNFGVNGLTSVGLAEQLQSHLNEIKSADAIVMSIGGNDLFQDGETLGKLDPANIGQIEEEYLRRLDGILHQLREQNQAANIYLIGLYNPFIELGNTETTTKIVRDWNYQTGEVTAKYPQTVLVPTFDLFQLHIQDYLAKDLFHPNAAGYRLIGERIASLMSWEGVGK
ncbi:GDSL-type esterase/lipase family protein [Paenibacillus solisilvae]|uniref:GDSL-type esterase/lipase family protein n=1 Tax=Paenibacillus solisilvae TaxID=2486751 RepID=A0ABW0W8V1_9BACL